MIHLHILSHLVNIEGREPYLCDFIKKEQIALYSDICRPISFKLDMMIGTTKLSIFCSVWIILTFFQGHSFMRYSKPQFLRNFAMDLDEIQSVATTCWFVEAHAKFILSSNIQRRELC